MPPKYVLYHMQGDEMEAILEVLNENELNTMRMFRQLAYNTAAPYFKEEMSMYKYMPLTGDPEPEAPQLDLLEQTEAIAIQYCKLLNHGR